MGWDVQAAMTVAPEARPLRMPAWSALTACPSRTRRRVLDDETVLTVVADLLGGQEERVGRRLAVLQARVVGGDRDLGPLDARPLERAVAVGLGARGRDGDAVERARVEKLADAGQDLDRAAWSEPC